jgi:hypothetical protein
VLNALSIICDASYGCNRVFHDLERYWADKKLWNFNIIHEKLSKVKSMCSEGLARRLQNGEIDDK